MLPLNTAPDKICILRLSALGDVSHAVPVVRAIQKHWPQTNITWICASVEYKLLSVLDGVRFVVVDKNAGWRGYLQLRRDLAGEKFDVMVQMQTSARANFSGALVNADIKLGWDRDRARDGHRFFMTHAVPVTKFEHQVQGHLSFARALGLPVTEPHWDFPISREARDFALEVMPAGKKYLLVSPCSSHSSRNWRADRYAAIADHAIERHAMSVVLTGGRSKLEASVGNAIEQNMIYPAKNVIGKDTLPQLIALLQRADLVLAPDSGPAHLANAVGTPVIGLHAGTWSRRSGPYNSLNSCVDRFADAARRYRDCAPEDLRWGTRIEDDGVMDLIEVDDVIERLDQLLSR